MSVSEFLSYFNGIYSDYDGAYGDQCFDLANGYSRWIGGPRFSGETADLIINQAGTFYTRIDNLADNFPIKGDIVVWNWPHVAVATGDNTDAKGFDALEQNDPAGSDCHLKHYATYNGVLGWLRPNKLPEDLQTQIDEIRKARDDNWNSYQAEVSKNTILQKQYDDEQKTNIALNDTITKITTTDKDYAQQLLDAQHKSNDLESSIGNIGKALQCPPDESSILKGISDLKQGKPLPKANVGRFISWLISKGINF